MKPNSLKYVCDVCGKKRSTGTKKVDHSDCSRIRQARFAEGKRA